MCPLLAGYIVRRIDGPWGGKALKSDGPPRESDEWMSRPTDYYGTHPPPNSPKCAAFRLVLCMSHFMRPAFRYTRRVAKRVKNSLSSRSGKWYDRQIIIINVDISSLSVKIECSLLLTEISSPFLWYTKSLKNQPV